MKRTFELTFRVEVDFSEVPSPHAIDHSQPTIFEFSEDKPVNVKGGVEYTPPQHVTLTGEQRDEFKAARDKWVGRFVNMITHGRQRGWKVARHIRGSQYELTRGNKARYAHHSSRKGWRWWVNRPSQEGERSDAYKLDALEQSAKKRTFRYYCGRCGEQGYNERSCTHPVPIREIEGAVHRDGCPVYHP